jgi:hypothetical protein
MLYFKPPSLQQLREFFCGKNVTALVSSFDIPEALYCEKQKTPFFFTSAILLISHYGSTFTSVTIEPLFLFLTLLFLTQFFVLGRPFTQVSTQKIPTKFSQMSP